LPCVAVCCRVLPCVAVCCRVLPCVAIFALCCSLCVAVCCHGLPCVATCALCCSVLQRGAVSQARLVLGLPHCSTLQHTATHCNTNTLQHTNTGPPCTWLAIFKLKSCSVLVNCSVLQCVAVCFNRPIY